MQTLLVWAARDPLPRSCIKAARSWYARTHTFAIPVPRRNHQTRIGRSSDPELGSPDLLIVSVKTDHDNGRNDWANLLTLGHSGGAVPELHRSSLFIGPLQKNCGPTTNAPSNMQRLAKRYGIVNGKRRTLPRGLLDLRICGEVFRRQSEHFPEQCLKGLRGASIPLMPRSAVRRTRGFVSPAPRIEVEVATAPRRPAWHPRVAAPAFRGVEPSSRTLQYLAQRAKVSIQTRL